MLIKLVGIAEVSETEQLVSWEQERRRAWSQVSL